MEILDKEAREVCESIFFKVIGVFFVFLNML